MSTIVPEDAARGGSARPILSVRFPSALGRPRDRPRVGRGGRAARGDGRSDPHPWRGASSGGRGGWPSSAGTPAPYLCPKSAIGFRAAFDRVLWPEAFRRASRLSSAWSERVTVECSRAHRVRGARCHHQAAGSNPAGGILSHWREARLRRDLISSGRHGRYGGGVEEEGEQEI